MISSQLGRMILDNPTSSADEMKSSGDYSGSDPLEELLEDVATGIGGIDGRAVDPSVLD